MNIESTDSWTQGLSHTACTTPTPAFTETLTFLTPRDAWLLKVLHFFYPPPPVSQFFPCSFFCNRLNIFWYKNKLTYDESTMFVNCFSPFSSCYCPAPPHHSSGLYWLKDKHDTGPQILSLPVHALFMDTWEKKKKKDGVMVEVGETVLKKRF